MSKMLIKIGKPIEKTLERLAYQEAEKLLSKGMRCDDCPKPFQNKAVGFVLHSSDLVSFLCQRHLDTFILKNGNIQKPSAEVTDARISRH